MNNFSKHCLIYFIAVNGLLVTAAHAESPPPPAPETQQAQQADPMVLIRTAIDDVMNTLKTNEALYKDNPEKLQSMIEKGAVSYFDLPRMAQLALGKNWRTATDSQKQQIVQEFQTYLLRSYVNTLYSYRNAKPKIVSKQDNGTDKTTVKVNVDTDQGKTVTLFFRVEKDSASNQWKIIDVNVEGVSLVITARGVFDDEIKKKGMDGFIQSLIEQNKKALSNGK